jgi:hypothetical protein
VSEKLIVVDFDGFNIGFASCFSEVFFEVYDMQDALEIANHWNNWIEGMDV